MVRCMKPRKTHKREERCLNELFSSSLMLEALAESTGKHIPAKARKNSGITHSLNGLRAKISGGCGSLENAAPGNN